MPLDRFQSIDPALLEIGPADRVIDLGCGTGRHVLALSTGPGNILGADLSRRDLRIGRYLLEIMRRRGEVRSRVHWLQSAGERLPFVDSAFDRVICTETLEHVDDDMLLARELVRVLKPGGILAVSVPDEYSERLFWRLSKNYRTHAGGHVRVYGRRAIVRLLRDAGLEPYAVRYRHSLETAYWLSHVAFWSDWGKQGPITGALRKWLDSARARRSRIVTAADDIGNRILPKSIVVYSRKPRSRNGRPREDAATQRSPAMYGDSSGEQFGAAGPLPPELARAIDEDALSNGHSKAASMDDDRTTVEVRAVPSPFPVAAAPSRRERRATGRPPTLTEELRHALELQGEERRQKLIELLRSCRFTLVRELQDVTEERASAPWTPDGRSLKEIVAHITGWEQWTIAAFDEMAEGSSEPAMMSLSGYPVGVSQYVSIDQFNAARMADARKETWKSVMGRSDTIFELLIAAIERAPLAALSTTAPFFWPDLGVTVPCGTYLLMVAAHHYQEEHLGEVKRD
jgi:SAM-dependent methyltransferase